MASSESYTTAYEDASLLIIDKPQGLATSRGEHISLCDLVFADFPYLEKVKGFKPTEGGLLNRLDTETGGLVLFAKTDEAFLFYDAEMEKDAVCKYYDAVVLGLPDKENGVINFLIAHHHKNKKKMIADTGKTRHRSKSRPAVTEWSVRKRYASVSALKVMIRKGARHQIRVHLAAVGMPIVGDRLYNKSPVPEGITCHLLYACGLSLSSPDRKKIEVFVKTPFLEDGRIDTL